jgi:hypothetical protein
VRGLLLLALLLPCLCHAQQVRIQAQELQYHQGVYILKGDVRLAKGVVRARAQEAVYEQASTMLSLRGEVFYEDQQVRIQAQEAQLLLRSKEGILRQALIFFKEDGYYVRAEQVHRSPDGRYVLREACASTCRGPAPAWSLRAEEARLKPQEYLEARGATFRMMRGLPVAYAPYVLVPLGRQRRSGLLAPNLGLREFSGLHVELPLYWAISPNRDLTLSGHVHTLRAWGLEAEFRHLELGGLGGTYRLLYLGDWKDDVNYLALRAEHRNPWGFVHLDMLNHPQMLRLWALKYQRRAQRYLSSRAELSRAFRWGRLYVQARAFQDLQEGASQGQVLQRLPALGLFLNPLQLGGGFSLHGRAEGANFWRKEGRWGQRLEVSPVFTYTGGQGVLLSQALEPSLRLYRLREPREDLMGLSLTYRASLRARLRRDYASYSHFLEPTAELELRRLLSLREPPVLFDHLEARGDSAALGLRLLSRLFKGQEELFVLSLGGSYDAERPGHWGPLELQFLRRGQALRAKGLLRYGPREKEIQEALLEVALKGEAAELQLTQRYQKEPLVWLQGVSLRKALGALSLQGALWYDFKGGGLRELSAEVLYKAQCWAVGLRLLQRAQETAVYIAIELLGLGGIGYGT